MKTYNAECSTIFFAIFSLGQLYVVLWKGIIISTTNNKVLTMLEQPSPMKKIYTHNIIYKETLGEKIFIKCLYNENVYIIYDTNWIKNIHLYWWYRKIMTTKNMSRHIINMNNSKFYLLYLFMYTFDKHLLYINIFWDPRAMHMTLI